MEHRFIVRHSSELSLKGTQAKRTLLEKLVSSIKSQASLRGINVKFEMHHVHFILFADKKEETRHLLRKAFGIGTFSYIEFESDSEFEKISRKIVKHFKSLVVDKTFALKVKRTAMHAYKSPQLEREVGAKLSDFGKVNLSDPEVLIGVDIIGDTAYVYHGREKGQGGFPLGSQGKALVMMSGGFDSAVAAWRVMRRGIKVDYLFLNFGGSAYARLVMQIAKVLNDLWGYGQGSKFYSMDFKPVSEAIKKIPNQSYSQVVLKRQMMRLAEKVRHLSGNEVIVTGESLGQVSSQTLKNIRIIDGVVPSTIIRPLIAMEKTEIVDQARAIGTAVLSEKVREYCSISSGRPVTNAKRPQVILQESVLPEELVEDSLATLKCESIDDLDVKSLRDSSLFANRAAENDILLDLQPKHLFRDWHLPGAINFNGLEVMKSVKDFDKTKRYFVYCAYGTQSPVVAEVMQQMGYESYAFAGKISELKKIESKSISPQ